MKRTKQFHNKQPICMTVSITVVLDVQSCSQTFLCVTKWTTKRVAYNMRRYDSVVGSLRHWQNNFNEELDILLHFLQNPNSFQLYTGRVLDLSKSKMRGVHRIYNFRPYQSHLDQELQEDDYGRCLIFPRQKLTWDAEENFLPNIVWTVNPRLSYFCPHEVVHSINVCCGFLRGRLIGPYLYGDNGVQFLNVLRDQLLILPEDILLQQYIPL